MRPRMYGSTLMKPVADEQPPLLGLAQLALGELEVLGLRLSYGALGESDLAARHRTEQ